MDIRIIAAIALALIAGGYQIFRYVQYTKMIRSPEYIELLDRAGRFLSQVERNRNGYFRHSSKEQLQCEYAPCFEATNANRAYAKSKNPVIKEFLDTYPNLDLLVKKWNQGYVEQELANNKAFFDDVDSKSLDDQQRLAVVTDEDNNLVVAGAGSGKTLTIAAKVKYLVEKKDVNPRDILLLSFTRKAAMEMQERISNGFRLDVEASTFHALGLSIISANRAYRPDIFEGLPAVVDEYFTHKVNKDKDLVLKILTFFGYYFSLPKDIETFDNLGESFAHTKNLDLETLRSKVFAKKNANRLDKKTLKNEIVKSLEEVTIANFLYLNGVKYQYERLYPFPSEDPFRKQYRPDFYLPEYDLYLEHFGITSDYKCPWLTPIEEKKYIEGLWWKRNLHQKNGTTLLETYSYFSNGRGLIPELDALLKANGVKFKEVDYADIYKTIFADGGDKYLAEFKKLVRTFLGLFKSNGYTVADFSKLAAVGKGMESNFHRERTLLFLSIVEPLYQLYQRKLEETRQIDFNDMINLASEIVSSGAAALRYKYIIVDEYQDISVSRFNLVKEIRNQTGARVMVVGDDWQSIYRFTGSDINLFVSFEKFLGYSETLKIERTYRNSQELIDIAGTFVMNNEKQLRKNLVSPQHHSNPVRILGYSIDLIGAFQEAVSEIVYLNGEESEIMVLGRNNSDVKIFETPKSDPDEDELDRYNRENRLFKVFQQRDGQIKIRYEKYPKLKIYFMTVHKAKGLEAENVIIVNLENRLVGFPNQISDDPLQSLLMVEADDFEFAEERRLFYVAITRSKNASYLLAPQVNKSLFVEELIKKQDIKYHFVTQERSLADNPPCPKCQTGHLVLRENSTDNSKFLGCNNYPLCDNTFKQIELLNNYVVCTKCSGYMVRRSGKFGPFYGCTNYPLCRNTIDVVGEVEPDQDDVVEGVARIRASGGR